ncbi:hypothetical protein Asi03nite_41140 [Actinoplanes siamensis]|uniref:Uncharacterized protein n=1 Tax=Actinoplanes siamensis TaxID=1223317 RepID=A0A919TKZ7_9ACTN|nr:hypothetical protein Asi03nite_41140 [Actinoplanes siamensis]
MEQVGDHDHGAAGVAPGVDLAPEVQVRPLVEALVRLVEQQQVGRVQLAEDQVELLPGAAGELLDVLGRSGRQASLAARCVPVERARPGVTRAAAPNRVKCSSAVSQPAVPPSCGT